jgi:hypothetical protein
MKKSGGSLVPAAEDTPTGIIGAELGVKELIYQFVTTRK